MIKEIQAKTILTTNKSPASWFGVRYNFNIYRGCEHQCIYCDSRSECYRIENFNDVVVKVNAIELLKEELMRKRVKGTIGTGAMSDPYTRAEKDYRLTRQALEVIAERRFPVHIITKSNMILRDADLLEDINRIYASVFFTITAADDQLAAVVEPYAPSSTDRYKAMGVLSALGICTGITMMPILPFIEDNEDNIREIIKKAAYYGAKYICPAFGVTMRDRQREYYYNRLDEHFPGVREKYQKRFGTRYSCGVNNAARLKAVLHEECSRHGISTKMPSYDNKVSMMQLSLFEEL